MIQQIPLFKRKKFLKLNYKIEKLRLIYVSPDLNPQNY